MIVVNCDLFKKEIEQNGIKCIRLWKSSSAIALRICKLFRKFHLYKYGNINPELNSLDSDCIVVFDNGIYENSVLKWIANRYYNKRLIFYYWNPVFKSISPLKIPKQFELWSYSPNDCKKYNMKYNSTFYFQDFCKKPVPIKRDVFFIGKNKGRLNKLMEIKKSLSALGISSLFYITANHPRLKQKKYQRPIPYRKVLEYVNESKIILDFYVNSHAGLSLRAMESIFFEKKIITNNETYPNYDFYNKENVFIMGKDKEEDLSKFISSPFVLLDNQIKKQYLFSCWINHFYK